MDHTVVKGVLAYNHTFSMKQPVLIGAVSGLIAGVVMGIMIIMMMGGTEGGTINKIAALYGFKSATAGFLLHLLHSIFMGALFGIIWQERAAGLGRGAGWGIFYGLIWWVLGPLLIMPFWLNALKGNMGVIRLLGDANGIAAALPSLPGHIAFGLVLGVVYGLMLSGGRSGSGSQSSDTQEGGRISQQEDQ